ncbi:MAG: hypothetical protein JNJ54_20910 [Myxococcaceae bacterium]|nr:hypothetical protein [Myxococcaceae bacterium]
MKGVGDELPAVQQVAVFRLQVPPALSWERVAQLARLLAPQLEVQARGAGWSEAVPLVLLDFDGTGLALTMRRRIEGDDLVVDGIAVRVDLVGDEAAAELLCVKLLTVLCEEGGARVLSSRFASGAATAGASRGLTRATPTTPRG